ncbi:MAG: response regulator, partial [Spirochaetia bacterium]
ASPLLQQLSIPGLPTNMDTATRAPAKLRILLAEDDRMNQVLMTRLLEKQGYNVQLAADGLQVIELLGKDSFDCILMDIQMPNLNGLDATRAIRNDLHLHHVSSIPIIAVTAHTMNGDREDFLNSGMDAYVPKPVLIQDLQDAFLRCGLTSQS